MGKFTRIIAGRLVQQNETGGGGGITTNDSSTRSTPTSVSAATTISLTSLSASLIYIQGNGGAVTMTASPQLQTSGMAEHNQLIVRGRSDTNTVTFVNGNGLSLNGDCTLGADESLVLMFDGVNWVEMGRS